MLISLTKYNIKRPERLNYDFPLLSNVNLIDRIKSKGLKSFLRKADEVLIKNNIEWEYKDLTEEKFLSWLPFYTEKMQEHDYDVRAKKEWYQEQIKKGHLLKGIFFYQNKKLVGSGIFGLHGEIASFAYKASDRIKVSSRTGSSLGSIMEFLFLKLSAENGTYKMATSRSRNAFGVINTLGYLEYKLKFGYTPRPSDNVPLLADVEVNEKGFVLFYGIQKGVFALFSLMPESEKGKELFDKSVFTASEIPFKEIYY